MTLIQADLLGDYLINVHFSDGTQRVINFADAFSRLQGYYAQYRRPELFQTFTIDSGNLVWDVIYPTWDLYQGNSASTELFISPTQKSPAKIS